MQHKIWKYHFIDIVTTLRCGNAIGGVQLQHRQAHLVDECTQGANIR